MADKRNMRTGFWGTLPSGGLQKLGIIASIILSGFAVLLTIRYGESKDQINQLIILSKKQDAEIQNLDRIYGEDRHQTKNSDELLGQIKTSNDKLVNQTRLLGDAVTILASDEKKAFRLQRLSDRASYMQLKLANERLFDFNDPAVVSVIDNSTPDKEMRIECLEHFKAVLGTQLSNTYLLSHKAIADQWSGAWIDVESTLAFENIRALEHQQRDRDGNIRPELLLDNEPYHIKMFNQLINKVVKLHSDIIKAGAWKRGETKIF